MICRGAHTFVASPLPPEEQQHFDRPPADLRPVSRPSRCFRHNDCSHLHWVSSGVRKCGRCEWKRECDCFECGGMRRRSCESGACNWHVSGTYPLNHASLIYTPAPHPLPTPPHSPHLLTP